MNKLFDVKDKIVASLRDHGDRWLTTAAALALAVTFLRPTMPLLRPLVEYVVVIDITQSMNVQDYKLRGKPASRLEFAKQVLREVLQDLPCGSKIGWGIFTEYRAFLLFAPVEVCENYPELISTLAHISGQMAWTGNSEIAKGLYSGLTIARTLDSKPGLVFITDGQESPPINPRFRPPYTGKKGDVRGLIVGAGGIDPLPIPKTDPAGRPLGFWRADEVMQSDPRSQGRGGSVAGEHLAEGKSSDEPVDPALVGPRGTEHLSSVREGYLKLLASETGLSYHHLQDIEALRGALMSESLARETPSRLDLRFAFAGLAFAGLLMGYLLVPARRALSDITTRRRRSGTATIKATAVRGKNVRSRRT